MRWILSFISLAFGYANQCNPTISIEEASRQASQFVGKVTNINLSKSKKGECYYRVRGSEGTALIDANTGRLLRFYRKN